MRERQSIKEKMAYALLLIRWTDFASGKPCRHLDFMNALMASPTSISDVWK